MALTGGAGGGQWKSHVQSSLIYGGSRKGISDQGPWRKGSSVVMEWSDGGLHVMRLTWTELGVSGQWPLWSPGAAAYVGGEGKACSFTQLTSFFPEEWDKGSAGPRDYSYSIPLSSKRLLREASQTAQIPVHVRPALFQQSSLSPPRFRKGEEVKLKGEAWFWLCVKAAHPKK